MHPPFSVISHNIRILSQFYTILHSNKHSHRISGIPSFLCHRSGNDIQYHCLLCLTVCYSHKLPFLPYQQPPSCNTVKSCVTYPVSIFIFQVVPAQRIPGDDPDLCTRFKISNRTRHSPCRYCPFPNFKPACCVSIFLQMPYHSPPFIMSCFRLLNNSW